MIITAGGENVSPIPLENKLKIYLGKYFSNVIVIGDKLKFISVLLNSEVPLPSNINSIIENAIVETNKTAPSAAQTIKKFMIITDKFKIGQELTPTLKLKRQFIHEKYRDKIELIYREDARSKTNKVKIETSNKQKKPDQKSVIPKSILKKHKQ